MEHSADNVSKVLVADTLHSAAITTFAERGVVADTLPGLDKGRLIDLIPEYDGLAVRSGCRVDSDVIAAAERLKIIGRAGIGIDNIDLSSANARGITVVNSPDGNVIAAAEHTIAMMFAIARQIPQANAQTKSGCWPKQSLVGTQLSNKTLGLIGCGRIGSMVARIAKAIGMHILVNDPNVTRTQAGEMGVTKVKLHQLLERADVISLHTPLSPATRNILSRENLSATKRDPIIVNCARGGLVDETALTEMLISGRISGAAFDVFTIEPARTNQLFEAPNFVATPHIGASTKEAQEMVGVQLAEQMSDFLFHGIARNRVN